MALSWYSFTGGTFSYLMMNARMSGVNAAPATEQLGMRHERKLDSVEDSVDMATPLGGHQCIFPTK